MYMYLFMYSISLPQMKSYCNHKHINHKSTCSRVFDDQIPTFSEHGQAQRNAAAVQPARCLIAKHDTAPMVKHSSASDVKKKYTQHTRKEQRSKS